MPRRARPPAGALLALALVTVVVLAAALTTPWQVRLPDVLTGPAPGLTVPPPAPAPVPTAEQQETPDPTALTRLLPVLLVVLVLLGVALAVVVVRRLAGSLRRTPPPAVVDELEPGDGTLAPDDDVPDLDELREGVQDARRRLDAQQPPRDLVVAAWVALEESAAARGTSRDPAQTPTEFAVAVLDRTPAPATDVTALRDLYHRARFTAHPVSGEQVDAARRALDHIGAALGTTRHATVPADPPGTGSPRTGSPGAGAPRTPGGAGPDEDGEHP